LIPPDDPRAIVDAVSRLLHDDRFRNSLEAAARQTIRKRFGIGPRTAELTALWRNLVINHPS
jgi:glycosyltransferase involved in cell wall biosynthesis